MSSAQLNHAPHTDGEHAATEQPAGSTTIPRTSTRDQLRFERLLAELSARFINAPAERIDAEIVDALRQIVELTGVDRGQLVELSPLSSDSVVTHSWAREGVPAVSTVSMAGMFPWGSKILLAGHPVVVSRVDRLPPEARVDRATWSDLGTKSSLVVPLIVAGRVEGAMALACLGRHRTWTDYFVTRAGILADVFANALAHKRTQEELQQALAFERLLANLSASILRAPLESTSTAIEEALRLIGGFLQVDRVAFWSMSGDRLLPTHTWVASGFAAPSGQAGEGGIRALSEPLSQGRVVNLPDLDDLPPTPEPDAQALRHYGKALLAVPLMADNLVVGALSFASVRSARPWPQALIPRIGLIGEAFAAVLAQRRTADQVREAQSEAARHRERMAHLARVHTVGEMSAAIAHEINQPLGAIVNYALAGRQRVDALAGPDTAKLEVLLGKIRAQAARAGDVIRRLREMVKPHDVEVRRVDLRDLVGEAVRLAELESRLTDFGIRLAVPPQPVHVLVDEIQIQQVIVNLLRNGIESMMDDPGTRECLLQVEVETRAASEARVRVLDTGRGVAAGEVDRIFEPFYTTRPGGLGIGLAVCRSIVESHGGALSCVPQAEGAGAEFVFTLPFADAEED